MYRAFPEGYRKSSCRLHAGGCGVETTRRMARGGVEGKGVGKRAHEYRWQVRVVLGDQPPSCTRLIYCPRLWLGGYRIRRRSGRSRVPIESCIKTTMSCTIPPRRADPWKSFFRCHLSATHNGSRGKKFLHGGKFFRLRRYVAAISPSSTPPGFYCGKSDMSNDRSGG